MSISKVVALTAITSSFLFAKIDFVKFGDICETSVSKSCKNNPLEIKVVQYLLNKRVDSNVKVSGKIDNLTKKAIISLQQKEGIVANGYIEKETKEALNKLLYGHKLHETKLTKKESKEVALKNSNTKELNVKNSASVESKKTESKISKKATFKSYREFINSVNLKKSYAVYKDADLLKKAGGKNTLLKVDVKQQRVKLVVNGKVAIDAPCTTGAKRKFEPNTKTYRDKRTPTGTFKVMEKIALKRSTIFGDIYKKGKIIYHGDRRKYKGSWKGVKFVGHPLKNWMRLTSNGIGLHASRYVKRYPGSNGCIRLQPKVATTIFKKIKPGTKVKIYN